MSKLTVIIPTFNEEENIEKCIISLAGLTTQIFVVDSFSSDRTKELAESLGGRVYQGQWKTFSEKINWALDNLPIETEWVMRLDADEVLGIGFVDKWQSSKPSADAYSIRRKFVFLEKELNFGGWGGVWDIRIWRHNHVRMENRAIDEHMIVSGRLERLDVKVLDDSHKSLPHPLDTSFSSRVSYWIEKHNKYSDLESKTYGESKRIIGKSEVSAKVKRFLKNGVYYRAPILFRPFIFFLYRYICLLGFLDGKQGLIIHVLHSFWYRFLIDVKIIELNQKKQ